MITRLLLIASFCSSLFFSSPISSFQAFSKLHDPSTDTLKIAKPCVVFYQPDSLRIQKMKQAHQGDDFYIIADDAMWYKTQARDYLTQEGMKFIDANKKFISFQMEKGSKTIYTDSLEAAWGLIMFDGIRPPLTTSLVDVHIDFKLYFGEK